MGLLDDAIREHLDLKRRRGADPSEVQRQEHEALGPARRGEEGSAVATSAPVADVEPDPDPVLEPDEPRAASEPGGAVSLDRFEDDVAWEAPPREPPASERAADPDAAAADGEDVLEETPEFFSETPEHDRLWFEQRPPRDFDFDG